MGEEFIVGLGQEALKVTMLVAGPILIIAMLVGIVISLLQAVTQINEATLTFVPKILAIAAVLVVSGPWMLQILMQYTTDLISRFPEIMH
jgi:flagellar biosynthetic protein FliQ